MAEDPRMQQCLFLMKNGVSEERAFSLPDNWRFAWCVIMSGFEGNEFDWETMSFRENQ